MQILEINPGKLFSTSTLINYLGIKDDMITSFVVKM